MARAFTLTMLARSRVGLPYGSIPRLLVAWLTTEAVRGRARKLVLELEMVPTGGRSSLESPDMSKHTAHKHVASHHSTGLRRVKIGSRVIVTEGINRPIFQDLFQFFMTVTWPQLFATFAAFFLSFDVLFGFFYYLSPTCLANLNPPGFAGAFFFSVETLATVGYGDMHPQTIYGHSVAMVEIFVGLMSLALITGIMFARFSRPKARMLFTRNGVVRPFEGKRTLMFRAANERQNVIQDASAKLRMLRDQVTQEGFRIRRVTDMSLIRSEHPLFVLGWTIMHVIDEASPLAGETTESLLAVNMAFVLSVSGTDENTGQIVMARAEYSAADILWDSTFLDILEEAEGGTLHLDYRKFHQVVPFVD